MSVSPEISVVIPVYRVEKFLRECVESVLNQTYRNFEIVLVDDGSPDLSPQICDEYAASYPPSEGLPCVRVVHKQNEGLGMARNTGMDAARGRFIFFLDSDDYLRPDTLEALWRVHQDYPQAQVIHGQSCRFIQADKLSCEVRGGRVVTYSGAEDLRRVAKCYFASFPGDEAYSFKGSTWGTLYDLKFLRRHSLRFYSERDYISEDYLFNFEVALHADMIAQLPDTFVRYRVNPNSLTQSPKAIVMERTIDYCLFIESKMSEAGFGPDAAKYAFGYAASRLRAQYKYMFTAQGRFPDKMSRARQWHQLPYFGRMATEFDPQAMSRIHRLHYYLFRTGSFRTLYALIHAQRDMRRLRGRIGD